MQESDDTTSPSPALARLLEHEERLEEELSRARAESREALQRARNEAERAQEQLPRELAETSRNLGERIASEHRAECSRIEERARREAEAFDAVDEERVQALADSLVERLLEVPAPRGPAERAP